MKLKKVLATILAAAMVLSTMSFSVFAEEKAQISGTIAGCAIEDYTAFALNRVEAENAMKEDDLSAQSILITFNNVPCIYENMTVQLYHDDELLSTTNATAKRLGQAYSVLTTNVVYSGDAAISGSWTTKINAPWTIDRAPNKIVVDIDGIETTFTNFEIAAFSKFEKFDLTAGSITPGYTNNTSIWGEGGANAKESFVVELYAGDEKIAQASLKNYEDIIDGDVYVTWGIPFNGEDSEYWDVEWCGNNPSVDTIPTKVVLVVDGVEVSRNAIQLNGPDNLNKIYAAVTDADGKILSYATSLESAFDKVSDGGRIELLRDVELAKAISFEKDITFTLDLNGCTIKGAFIVTEASTVVFENGIIINENPDVSAIETVGTTTLTNLNVTSARHGVRVEGGKVVVNGGAYAVNNKDGKTVHAINVSDGGEVIINDGNFTGPKGTAADSGSAVCVQAGSTVIINGGMFTGGKLSTLAAKPDATLIVLGGTFDQDPSAYVGNGYIVTPAEDVYTVEEDAASEVKVVFEQVEDKENVYNIVLEGVDDKEINEFVAAELTFDNDSTTANGKEMTYEVSGYTENGAVKTVVDKADAKADTYALRLVGGANRMTGSKLTIGQVTFNGQGTIKFNVESGRVVATKKGYNVEKYYIADGVDATEDTLILDDSVIGADTTKVRDVIVNIDYKHILDGTGWDDNQITVTLKDSFGENVTPVSSNDRQVKFENVQEGRIVVTLEAPGFRKYVYTTMLKDVEDENDALVLNFWNNVKKNEKSKNGVIVDPEAEIEAGTGDFMTHNFLVGDIVMDMTVDEYDLAAVTSYYGMYGLTDTSKIGYDLNRDGNIDIIDVAYVLHTMGN